MEYMPYILLLQTLVLIIVEKFTFKIPRIAQKVERFYQNIVEESLFGKDPVKIRKRAGLLCVVSQRSILS
jgi:hypothetical protein